MPITVTLPPSGGPLGPGLWIDATTTHVFADPGSAEWEFDIKRNNELVFVISRIRGPIDHLFWQMLTNRGQEQWNPGPAWQNLTQGEPLEMFLEFQDSGVVVESITVPILWETTAGLGWQQYFQPTTTVTGGFTAQDREQLGEIQLATVAGLPTNLPIGGIANTGLSALMEGPPDQLLRRGETVLLTGEGSLNRPPGSGSIEAYGAIWDFAVVPPGFGFVAGPVLEYERRMARFAVVRVDSFGNEFTHDLVDVHSSFGKMRFPWACRRIDYKIAPGVTLAFTWLIFVVAN